MKTRVFLWSGLLLGLAAGLAVLAVRSPSLGADLIWQMRSMLDPPSKAGERLQR